MKKMVGRARELLALAEEFNLEEIQLDADGLSFRANRSQAPSSPQPPAAGTNGASLSAPEREEAPEDEVQEAQDARNLSPVASPMVGVFYVAASPDKPPYVKEGDVVEPDTTVCIVEAMKLMNEIKAGLRGKISKCLVSNQTPVKAGQTLFLVEPV